VNLLVVVLAVSGALFGVAADRLAVRWPEHDEEEPAGRPIGWRTVASAAMGAFAFGLLGGRFGGTEPLVQILFGAWFACLVIGLIALTQVAQDGSRIFDLFIGLPLGVVAFSMIPTWSPPSSRRCSWRRLRL